MSSLYDAFAWLAHTPISQTFNGASYLYFGLIMAAHLLGLTLLGGTSLLIDLRLLGLGLRDATPRSVTLALKPWLWIGLALVVLTGTWMLVADPLKYYVNPSFRIKVVLLLLAIALQLWIQRKALREDPIGIALRGLSLLALLLWLATTIAGRVIGLI